MSAADLEKARALFRELAPQMSDEQLYEWRREVILYALMRPDITPEQRREFLRDLDNCPCCGA
jgi:hypothetical protein